MMMAVDILSLSDDELMSTDLSTLLAQGGESENEAGESTGSTDPDETPGAEGQAAESVAGAEGTQATDEDDAGQGGDKDQSQEQNEPAGEAGEKVEGASETSRQPDTSTDTGADSSAQVDYKTEHEKLLAPFNANGREMTVASVEEARTLMQMGANYNKKMAAIKPNLKLLKLLESNGLLSEEKIGFLIDLEKKNPEAISKLVKESGIDPIDLDAEKADGYRPTVRAVNDSEIELDEVLEEIASTESYQRTVDVVGKQWDQRSKQLIAENPQLLRVVNQHVQSGVYDLIASEVERERVFGRLQGLSDIEAYRQVGDSMNTAGKFDHLGTKGQQTEPVKVVVTPKPKQVEDEKIKDKRRAASTTKPAVGGKSLKDLNPLALSDEEFSKIGLPHLM